MASTRGFAPADVCVRAAGAAAAHKTAMRIPDASMGRRERHMVTTGAHDSESQSSEKLTWTLTRMEIWPGANEESLSSGAPP